MSIPTTETKPDGLHSLSPRQRRSLRKHIGNASTPDKIDVLSDIARHALPRATYYWQLLICLALLVISAFLGSSLVFLAGIIAIPMAKPLLSLVYAGALPSVKHFWHALLSFVITIAGFFLAGWVVRGMESLQIEIILHGTDLSHVGENGLFWVLLILTSALTAYWFPFHETLARLASIFLGCLVLPPFFAAGQAVEAGFMESALPIIIVGLIRLTLAALVMLLTTWAIGFPPRKSFGLFIAILVLAAATLSVIDLIYRGQNSLHAPRQEATLTSAPSATPAAPTSTALPPTATMLPPTATATTEPSPTPEPPATAEPTALDPTYTAARVTAPNGLVLRTEPSTSSIILAYLDFKETVWLTGDQETNQGIIWAKVVAPDGIVGWASAQYLQKITP